MQRNDQIQFKIGLFSLFFFGLLTAEAQAGTEAGAALGAEAKSPGVCIISSMRGISADNMTFTGGNNGAAVQLIQMIDQKNARLRAAKISLSVYAICNMPHQLTLISTKGALIPETSGADVQGAFLKEIRYRATARWGAQTLTLFASGITAPHITTKDIPSAQRGDLTIEITVDGVDNDLTTPVLVGHYADTVRFIFSPQP